MADKKKVCRVCVEKVKNGDKGHLHKVTAEYHASSGKGGRGLQAAIGKYQEPESTFHDTPGKAAKHVKKLMGQMTATPDEAIASSGDDDSDY